MSPECLYWLALVIAVLPSVAFNRVAIVVLLSWAFGHIAHIFGPYEDAACMFARIVAFGAALGLSHPWDGSRRAIAQLVTTALFLPSAGFSFVAAVWLSEPATTMAEWHAQVAIYWGTWTTIMLQALSVPFGNDWEKAKNTALAVDNWLMSALDRHFNSVR